MKTLLKWLFFCGGILAGGCYAHTATQSSLMLDIEPNRIGATLELPEDQLSIALAPQLGLRTLAEAHWLEDEKAVNEYLHQHFSANDPVSAKAYSIKLRALERVQANPVSFVRLSVDLIPPEGASVRQAEIVDTLILHQVVTHKTLVTLRSDFARGQLPSNPQVLGWLRYQHSSLLLKLDKGGLWMGLAAMIKAGFEHILAGVDHLVFLLVTLIPIPLVVRSGRWLQGRPVSAQFTKAVQLVSTFTLGHCITLALSSLHWVMPPSQPIEILVALTILVSALHSVRPLMLNDWLITLAFGCIHGFAFAETLNDLHFSGSTFALTLLGFNLGIELAQLMVLASVLPLIMLLGRYAHIYKWLRLIVFIVISLLASVWMLERTEMIAKFDSAIIQKAFSAFFVYLKNYGLLLVIPGIMVPGIIALCLILSPQIFFRRD